MCTSGRLGLMLAVVAAAVAGCGERGKTLELFVGSASKPATEEIATLFEQETGCKVLLHFGGSGKMLSDMKLSHRGDLYFPGSSDFMELARKNKLVLPETEKIVVYLIPAINVPAGNPKGIQSLDDLAKPGVRVGIARPDQVCVGLYAVEVLVHNKMADKVRPNIVTNADSCAKTANLLELGTVDAILGWRVFQYWNPKKIQTVLLAPVQVPRVGYIPIAQSVFCKQPEVAKQFIDFLQGDKARAVFEKWHYLATEAEARKLAAPDAPVGGVWALPEGW